MNPRAVAAGRSELRLCEPSFTRYVQLTAVMFVPSRGSAFYEALWVKVDEKERCARGVSAVVSFGALLCLERPLLRIGVQALKQACQNRFVLLASNMLLETAGADSV